MAATTARVLDAADPPPRRDEARFAGDYKAFRAAFQAWDCRERRRRKKVQLHDADAADVPAGAEHEMPNTKPAKRKYRSMLPRPRREAFDTEADFEDAMAERGAARDVRRRVSCMSPGRINVGQCAQIPGGPLGTDFTVGLSNSAAPGGRNDANHANCAPHYRLMRG